MSARRVSDLDAMALLEEQRDDLLATLDTLDAELASGAIDATDHAELSDDLTRRTADVIRRIEDMSVKRPAKRPPSTKRRVAVIGGLLAIAIMAGVAVAASSGLRLSGQFGTGDINRSSRDLLLQGDVQFGSGDLDGARATATEVLERVPGDVDALVLLARVEEREGDILAALMSLDAALESEPDAIEPLTLKGWILVRLPEEDLWSQGIELLDEAIAREPNVFDPFLFRAIAAERLENDPAEAERYYREALARNPPAAMVPQIEGFIAALG